MINKKFVISICFIIFLLTGCTPDDKVGTALSGEKKYSRVCIDGVEYLKRVAGYRGFMVPHFKPTGELYTCGKQ